MNPILGPALMQLAVQSPVLLVCVVGAVFAISQRSAAPLACSLGLAGLLILVLILLIQPFVVQFVIHSHVTSGSSGNELQRLLGLTGIFASFLHAGGLGLIVAAIFVQRRQPGNAA